MAGDTVVLPLPTNPNAGPSNEFTYDHSNPRGYAEVILALLMLIASWITVGLRFIARKHINSIGADDYLIIVAQVCRHPRNIRYVESYIFSYSGRDS